MFNPTIRAFELGNTSPEHIEKWCKTYERKAQTIRGILNHPEHKNPKTGRTYTLTDIKRFRSELITLEKAIRCKREAIAYFASQNLLGPGNVVSRPGRIPLRVINGGKTTGEEVSSHE